MCLSIDSVWNLYLATRLHYLKGYDAVKYGGKIKFAEKAQQRPDKVLVRASLADLSDRREVIEFCIANFLNENDNFLYESQEDASGYYSDWKKYWSAADYMLQADVSTIEVSMYKAGVDLAGYLINHAHSDVLRNRIRRETLCVFAFKSPGCLTGMKGFGAERLVDRIEKTLPFIKNRLSEIKVDLDLI